jgi:hypothetical protein
MASRPAPAGATDSERLGGGDLSLLIRAITMPAPQARAAWRKWRASVDVDQLGGETLQLIPVLGGRLTDWLRDDPAAGVFRGILRRAWTETQLRLSVFRSVAAELEQAGCGPVLAAGSLVVCLLNRLPDSVRPIYDIRLLIRRGSLARAAEVLQATGWRLSGSLPAGEEFDWAASAHFSRQGISLMLQWRALPGPVERAAVIEAEFLDHSRSVECRGLRLQAPGPEHVLLAALCGRYDFDADAIPWQVDAALLPLDAIVWRRWRKLADALAPEAFGRLQQLRELGLAAPRIRRPAPPLAVRAAPHVTRMRKFYYTWRGRGGRIYRRLKRAANSALRSRYR